MLKTWDIFDTLIARRCIASVNVFKIMEQVTKIAGFTNVRLFAERNLINRGENYTLDDIYTELNNIFELTESSCKILKEIECQTEIEQAIPITENILQVKSGDILISDMYLPEKIIRKMLEKCGLIVPVEIVITSNGKSSGRIWKQIAAQNQFVFHIGDNEISDIKTSRDAGFDSAVTTLSSANGLENFLLYKDFYFAAYLRELRLKNPYKAEMKRLYWQYFTLNAGILIMLVQLIDDFQKKYDFEYLGFCGRDTYYLWHLYKKFKEDKNETPTDNDYLYYSRKLVYNSKNEMIKYFSSKIGNKKAMMIDLGGTGTRLRKLRAESNLKYSILLCFNYSTQKIEDWTPVLNSFRFYSERDNDLYFINRFIDTLEFLNRATHNTPIKLNTVQIAEKIIPSVVFSEISDTENLDVIENFLKETLKNQVNWGGSGVNALENLQQLSDFVIQWGRPLISNNRHYINEVMDEKFTHTKKI